MKTNLFIAGACKSGTSFLHDFLGKQDDICASIPKEPYFFELTEKKRNTDDYYNSCFKHHKSEAYLLDGRHRNMFFSWIPAAIHSYNKDSKLIFILRNPVERAYSHWWMWYSRRVIKSKFFRTVSYEIKRINNGEFHMDLSPDQYADFCKTKSPHGRMAYADSYTIVESGYYYTQINRFMSLFKSDQILILDYKELSNPKALSKKLENFLRVPISEISGSNEIINQAPLYKKKKYFLSKYLPKRLKTSVKELFFKKHKLDEKSRQLLKDHYEVENTKLATQFQVDFVKEWL